MNLLKSNDNLWAVLLPTEQNVDAFWGLPVWLGSFCIETIDKSLF